MNVLGVETILIRDPYRGKFEYLDSRRAEQSARYFHMCISSNLFCISRKQEKM